MLARARFERVLVSVTFMMFAAAATAQSSSPSGSAPNEPPAPVELMRAPFPLAPPAVGPRCESARILAPDNQCAAFYIQTRGSGRNAQVSVQLDCNWEGRMFQNEIIRVFTSNGVSMRWVDATTLELNLPPEVHFSPPPEQSGYFGHTIRFRYRHVSDKEAPPRQCLGPAPNYMKARVLNGPEVRRASAPGWVAYEAEGACMLIGSSPTGPGSSDTVVTSFQKDAIARLPLGITELMFSVTVPRTARGAPQVRVGRHAGPQLAGTNGNYRIIGAEAQRILDRLAKGNGAQVSFTTPDAGTLNVDLTQETFAEGHRAFKACVRASKNQLAN